MESRPLGWPEQHSFQQKTQPQKKAGGSFNRWPFDFAKGYMKQVPMGARGEAEETVEFKHTLTAHHPQLPPVYSTPDMIRLMETAAFLALQPYCEGDEISVGTAINIEHRAASGIGTKIKAEAIVESFDGRFYTVRVSARDGEREIGRGTVGRAVVSVSSFASKSQKSAEA